MSKYPILVRITDKHINSGNISISQAIINAYYRGEVSSIVVCNEAFTQFFESYSGRELVELMESKRPFYDSNSDDVAFYLAKRK